MREWWNLFFFEKIKSDFKFSFLDNPDISGPGKCKIWNLCIKMSKTPKYGLWEMMGSFYLCFQDISMKLTLSYWALCHGWPRVAPPEDLEYAHEAGIF